MSKGVWQTLNSSPFFSNGTVFTLRSLAFIFSMTAHIWAKNWPGVTFGGGLPMLRAARAPSSWPVVLDCTLLELSWTPVVSVSLADIKVERRKCRRIRRWPLASNLASKSEGASRMLRGGRSGHTTYAILVCLLFLVKIIDWFWSWTLSTERTRISPLEFLQFLLSTPSCHSLTEVFLG